MPGILRRRLGALFLGFSATHAELDAHRGRKFRKSFHSLRKEGQLDGALEEAEQGFFLLFRAADLLDLMAAEATELQ